MRKTFARWTRRWQHLYEVDVPEHFTAGAIKRNGQHAGEPNFVRNVLGKIMTGRGDRLPVSALPNDGTYPTGTTRFEKRNLAAEVPVWDPDTLHSMRKMRAGLSALR